ncbi:MAG: hypothetical protein P8Y23_08050 [Candidatus Lokiarchaeota archaeon]
MNENKSRENDFIEKLRNFRMKPVEEQVSQEQKREFKSKQRERVIIIIVFSEIGFIAISLIIYFWNDILLGILP